MKNFDIINFLKEGGLNKSTELLKEDRAPGFAERKQGEPLPTLEGIKAAYEAKNGGEPVKEDLFVDADFEDLEQVVRNLAHTAEDVSEKEAAEKAIEYIQRIFGVAEDEDDLYEAEDGEVVPSKVGSYAKTIDQDLKDREPQFASSKSKAQILDVLTVISNKFPSETRDTVAYKTAVKAFYLANK
jgi:hypothetical protein